ncbi:MULTISPECIES: hypothetical protein [unclassified Agarivorans]|uniref:hypothetical protein n=1 Tax=unclassified Agarivorans TaxID=2636026 RepID=UPI003D7EAD3B
MLSLLAYCLSAFVIILLFVGIMLGFKRKKRARLTKPMLHDQRLCGCKTACAEHLYQIEEPPTAP